MKQVKVYSIIGLFLVACAAAAQGQPEKNVGSVEIDVVDQYKASIKKAVKISKQPDFVDTTTQKLPVQYRINPQILTFTYHPEPIKPVRVKGVRLGKLPKNMVKLGAGLYTTSLAEVRLSSSRSQKFNWDLGLTHFRTQSGVKDIAYDRSPFTENNIYAGGRWLLKDYRAKVKVGIDWNRYHYYGIPKNVKDAGTVIPDLQQNDYQRYFASTEFDRIYRKNATPFQSAGIAYHYFVNNWNTAEHQLDLATKWHLPKDFKDQHIGAEFNVMWMNTDIGEQMRSYNQLNVQFLPQAKGRYQWFAYTLGLNLNFFNTAQSFNGTTTSDFALYFYPEIALEAELVRDVLGVFAGWTGDVTANGQYSLTKQNPFLLPGVSLAPTGSTKVYAGFEGAVAKNLSFKAEANLRFVTSLPLFYRSGDSVLTTYANEMLPAFDVRYAKGNIFQVRGELTYNSKNTTIGAYGELFSYSLTNELDKIAYHLPNLRIGINFTQQIKEKFEVNGGLAFIGGREALAADGNIYSAKLDDIWDAHLGVAYNINNNLSAGLEFSNLASQQYDVWLGYPAQRIRALFVLTYKF